MTPLFEADLNVSRNVVPNIYLLGYLFITQGPSRIGADKECSL